MKKSSRLIGVLIFMLIGFIFAIIGWHQLSQDFDDPWLMIFVVGMILSASGVAGVVTVLRKFYGWT